MNEDWKAGYDSWKTADNTPEDKRSEEQEELELVYEKLFHLRASHAELLAAAKAALRYTPGLSKVGDDLRASIAKAEEIAL